MTPAAVLPSAIAHFGWATLLIDVLTVARLVRLVQRDQLPFGKLRARSVARQIDPRQRRPIRELWTCPWCLSMWVAAAVVGLHLLLAGLGGSVAVAWWTWTGGLVLAYSYVAGWLAAREDG